MLFLLNEPLSQYGKVQLDDLLVTVQEHEDSYDVMALRNEALLEKVPKHFLSRIAITKTGDEYSHKICDRCYKHLPSDTHFSNNRIKKGGKITKRPSCKACRKIKNGKSIKSQDRLKWETLKPKLGQLFTCPICTKTSIGGVSKHVLDHNHQTGQVRGYLCESCNTGIGRFDDNVELVKNAITWLNQTLDP